MQDRIDVFRDMIAALAEDAQNDAKGSAGDKHETSLSMMHLEQEKLSAKLQEAIGQLEVLERLETVDVPTGRIAMGSFVKCGGLHLYISTALPKITEESVAVFAVSPLSPLGSALMGKQVGDSVVAGGKTYVVEKLYE